MFPITSERRFFYTVQGDPDEAAYMLRYYLADRLGREGARNVTIDGKRVRFGGRMWVYGSGSGTDFFRLHFLNGLSKGRITVDYRDTRVGVTYQISFIGYGVYLPFVLMWWALVFTFSGMSFGDAVRVHFWDALPVLGFWLFGFALFFAVNTAVTRYRFKWFVEDRLREFFTTQTSWGVPGKLTTSR